MPERSSGGSGFDDQETSLGGADAVPDTPDTVERGAEPNRNNVREEGGYTASISGGGISPVVWVVGIVAVLALIAYAVGIFR